MDPHPRDIGSGIARQRGRIGALARWSREDPTEQGRVMRAGFERRFIDAQPADLPEPERLRRAAAARRLYFARLALKSAEARASARSVLVRETARDG